MFNNVPKTFMLIDKLVCYVTVWFLSFFLLFLFSVIFLFLTFLFSSYAFFSFISKHCNDSQLWFFSIIVLESSFFIIVRISGASLVAQW